MDAFILSLSFGGLFEDLFCSENVCAETQFYEIHFISESKNICEPALNIIYYIKDRHQFSFSAPYDVDKETRESLFTKAAPCHLHLSSKMLGSFIQI